MKRITKLISLKADISRIIIYRVINLKRYIIIATITYTYTYIYCSTNIDIKIKFEIPFHPSPRRTYNISSKPKSAPQKNYKKTISNLLKNTIYIYTIFIQKKEKRKIQKSPPTFQKQEERENRKIGKENREWVVEFSCNQFRFNRNPVEDGNPTDSLPDSPFSLHS